MEVYRGVKFKYKIIKGSVAFFNGIFDVVEIVKRFIKPIGNEGNLSIRANRGMLITRTGSNITNITYKDVVYVPLIMNNVVYSIGDIPSSESIMHYNLYKSSDANIVLHFHNEELLNKKFDVEIGPFEYGTLELANAVKKFSKKQIIKIREHGFVVISKNKNELLNTLTKLFLKI